VNVLKQLSNIKVEFFIKIWSQCQVQSA